MIGTDDTELRIARGKAIARLVMPCNLLTSIGLLNAVFGIGLLIWGMWPIVFNPVAPGRAPIDDVIFTMFLGTILFIWGMCLCIGAYRMQSLSSYKWAMVGAVMGIPLLIGLFAVAILQDSKVKAGFKRPRRTRTMMTDPGAAGIN
jgi:hypothetical protein